MPMVGFSFREDLREFAELKRDVVLVSRLKKFQVWDKANWKEVFADSKEKIANNPGLMRSLGIHIGAALTGQRRAMNAGA